MRTGSSDECADRLRDQGWSYGFTRALGEDGCMRYVVDMSRGGTRPGPGRAANPALKASESRKGKRCGLRLSLCAYLRPRS